MMFVYDEATVDCSAGLRDIDNADQSHLNLSYVFETMLIVPILQLHHLLRTRQTRGSNQTLDVVKAPRRRRQILRN